jgi:competence protein ComEA
VLWVHVAGAVRTPGLYELPSGSRVGDAVTVAGGTLEGASLSAVNLARLLDDGEQVYVPSDAEVEAGEAPAAAAHSQGDAGSSQGSGAAAGVDINRAGATELEALPGVGPATAAKIISDREANGPFASPEDIMRVPGIGEKKFESMRELIVVK